MFLGHWSRNLDPRLFVAGFEGTVYAGPVILLLALGVSIGRGLAPRWVWRATIVGAIFYLLSLGPSLRFLGRPLAIPGPAALLYHLPFGSFVSAPARFDVITALCLAILCSMGSAALLERLAAPWQRHVAVAVLSCFLLADLLTIPFPRSSAVDPASPSSVAAPSVGCTVPGHIQAETLITYPMIDAPYSLKSMWMQVLDRGRYALFDGYVSYGSERFWEAYYENPVLRSLLSLQGEFRLPAHAESDREAIPVMRRDLHLGAIIVFDSPDPVSAIHYLEKLLGQSGERAGSCTVFDLGQPAQAASARTRFY